jgi:hypothetical protein
MKWALEALSRHSLSSPSHCHGLKENMMECGNASDVCTRFRNDLFKIEL